MTLKEKIEALAAGAAYQKAKGHFEENQKFYIGAAISVVVCLSVIKRGQPIHNSPTFNNTVAPVIAPVFNNTNTVNNGPMYKIVKDLDTGQIWGKIKDLAEEIAEEHGISPESARTRLRNQMIGLDDNLYGHRYAIIGHGPGL